MKKTRLILFGVALFIAGSAYTRRQAEFIAHQKQVAVSADRETEAAQVRSQRKNTTTYQPASKR